MRPRAAAAAAARRGRGARGRRGRAAGGDARAEEAADRDDLAVARRVRGARVLLEADGGRARAPPVSLEEYACAAHAPCDREIVAIGRFLGACVAAGRAPAPAARAAPAPRRGGGGGAWPHWVETQSVLRV